MPAQKKPSSNVVKKKPAGKTNASDGSDSDSPRTASREESPTAESMLRERHPEVERSPGKARALENLKDQGVFTYLIVLNVMPAKALQAHVVYVDPLPAKASPVKFVYVHDGL